jgi:hypothetical protein
VADHRNKTTVHLPGFAAADLVDGRLHVVVDAALWHTLECLEGVAVCVEQHLVALLQVGAVKESPAVAELEVRHLQLGADAVDDDVVLAPVELEGLARAERQRHEGVLSGGALRFLLLQAPLASEGRHPVVRAGIAKIDPIAV